MKKMPATTYSPTFCYVVPSALEGLTSVFGMGTGVTPPLVSPAKIAVDFNDQHLKKEIT